MLIKNCSILDATRPSLATLMPFAKSYDKNVRFMMQGFRVLSLFTFLSPNFV